MKWVVIVDTYSRSLKAVEGEEDMGTTIQEVDTLIHVKSSQRGRAPLLQEITYDNYERQVRHVKSMMQKFEEVFKESNRSIVEVVDKKHELMRKKKLRINTERDDEKNEMSDFAMELQQIAEEIATETHYDLQFEKDDDEVLSFSQRALEQNIQRNRVIEEWTRSYNSELAASIWEICKPIKNEYLDNKPAIVLQIHQLVESTAFQNVMLVVILLNTVVLALVWPHMNDTAKTVLEVFNSIFTVIFVIELVLMLIGLGPRLWWSDHSNIFDGIIVMVSLVDLIVSSASNHPKIANVVLAFRALRVLRILRLFHRVQSLRILLNAILEAVEPIALLFLILALFLFMVYCLYMYIYIYYFFFDKQNKGRERINGVEFGVLGVQMFSTHVQKLKINTFEQFTKPWRFDNLWFSIMTFMQLFSGDGWMYIMFVAVYIPLFYFVYLFVCFDYQPNT
ncbi:voltage-dependent T-type calcium channel subunit alpha-1H [Reticulomyxa filosa]|uniref:Voltage-dependent T-type calcium channel subunit alpha-1H n=1 Tax=Reticulomyxa filosa TaxID=46433 RepID=X6N3J9_RETFI|nr:voltage-dependent T-type calcium channel subunit alpha-1H [Reticulomyxa filosa]|eukprot:ETO20855.1 voltage-dependent T-type calcium channel subunit alpha-1H [Reticulomyxa filosa]